MSHPRSTIRNAIIDRLKAQVDSAYLTDAEDRIYGNRAKPLFDQFLPAILVYAKDENILEERFETDEEYEKRMKNDAYFEETLRITELKELERLKEKYEK